MKPITLNLSPRQVRELRLLMKTAVADGRVFEKLNGRAFITEAKKSFVFPGAYGAAEERKAKRFLAVYEQLGA